MPVLNSKVPIAFDVINLLTPDKPPVRNAILFANSSKTELNLAKSGVT